MTTVLPLFETTMQVFKTGFLDLVGSGLMRCQVHQNGERPPGSWRPKETAEVNVAMRNVVCAE